jgi:hypothetical protein
MKVYQISVSGENRTDNDGIPIDRILDEGMVYATREQAEAVAARAQAQLAEMDAERGVEPDGTSYDVVDVWINVGAGEGGCEAGDELNIMWSAIQTIVAKRLGIGPYSLAETEGLRAVEDARK